MNRVGAWLLQDDQRFFFDLLAALVLTLSFLALAALLLWPLGGLMLTWGLAKGYVVLWIALTLAAGLVNWIQRLFRVNLYDHPDAFVISNLGVACFLLAGWSAFAALAVRGFATGVPAWVVVIFYLFGALSSLVAFFTVASFYHGTVYKLVSLPVALVAFLVFSAWPASARALYGCFFWLF